jgi:deoxyribose-phosphate aldolase
VNWISAINQYLGEVGAIAPSPKWLEKIFGLIDLTSLNATDTEESIALWCEKAVSPFGQVAAVCVFPYFVRQVAATFANTPIKTATVANFPEGNDPLETILLDIGRALEDGAQEIDVVFPYQRYLAGERQYARTFVSACKTACGDAVTLKVILETGILVDFALIADASWDALTAGADFIKTSTGKSAAGASLEAAAVMLLVIQHVQSQLKKPIGLKISGGIKEISQAAQYIALAEKIMGPHWVTPATFRIGTSKLVDEMVGSHAKFT